MNTYSITMGGTSHNGIFSLKTLFCVAFAVIAVSAVVLAFVPSVTNAWWYEDTPSCIDCGGGYGGDWGYGGDSLGGYGYTYDNCYDCYGGGYSYDPGYYPTYNPCYYDCYGGYYPQDDWYYSYDSYTYIYTPPTYSCPSGTTGTYPNCAPLNCPSGTTGVYPNCVQLTCPSGTTGVYPNCVQLTCPSGTTGVYPNCVQLTCPSGTTGVYPNCVQLTCPAGTTGVYPNCITVQQQFPSCSIYSNPSSLTQGGSATLQWTTSNAVTASIDLIGSVSTGSGSRSVSPSSTTNYTMTVTNSTGQTAQCSTSIGVLPTPPQQNPPTCSMYINSLNNGNTNGGQTVGNLVWNSNNATSGYINQVGSVGPNGSQQVYANNTTTYYGTFTGPSGTVNCTATLYVNTQPQACDLRVSSTNITQGQSVVLSWSSYNSYSGFINGVGSVSGNGSQSVSPQTDTLYTATFNGPNGQQTCTAFVRVQAGQVAGVFLSQVPYTGFEAGPALTALFWITVALFAAVIAYFVAGRGTLHYMLAHVAGAVGLRAAGHSEEKETETLTEYPEMEEHQGSYAASVMAPSRVSSQVPFPAASPVSESEPTRLPEISDVIESRAHAAGVLMSPEAVSMAAELSGDRAETLRAFGDILNEAVRIYPREDGWIMLTSDRFSELKTQKGIVTAQAPAASVEKTIAASALPVSTAAPIEKIDEASATEFVRAIVSGNRDGAFSITRALEQDSLNPTTLITATATVLDRLYRARTGSDTGADQSLVLEAKAVSDESLHKLVETFAHAVDATYGNRYTGLKLALAQAFEIVDA